MRLLLNSSQWGKREANSAHHQQGTEKKNRNKHDVCTQGNTKRLAEEKGVAPRTGSGWGGRWHEQHTVGTSTRLVVRRGTTNVCVCRRKTLEEHSK